MRIDEIFRGSYHRVRICNAEPIQGYEAIYKRTSFEVIVLCHKEEEGNDNYHCFLCLEKSESDRISAINRL